MKDWNVHFASLKVLCHLKDSDFEPQFHKVPRLNRTPRWHCERWFRIIRSIYLTRIISISNDSRKSTGHYIKASRMFRSSSCCSIHLYAGHYSIIICFTNLFLCHKPWTFPQRKQRWTRNRGNWRKFRRGTWRKSEVRKRWSMKQGRTAQKFIWFHWWTYVIWIVLNWRQSTKKYKGRVVLLGDSVKRRLWILRSIHRTRIFSITNDSRQNHGYHPQIAGLRTTICWRSHLLIPRQNGGCAQITENSKIGMSRLLDSSTTTQMAEIMVQYGRYSGTSWAESVRSSFGRTIMEDAIWVCSVGTRLGKVLDLECLFVNQEKGLLISVTVDVIKIGWQETEHQSDLAKVLMKDVESGRIDIISWPRIFGMHSKRMSDWQGYCGRLIESLKYARTKDFFRGCGKYQKQKATVKLEAEIISSWSYDRKVTKRNCVERYCELANKTTQQFSKLQLHAWMTIKKRKKKMNL